jgi:hypothetical protein
MAAWAAFRLQSWPAPSRHSTLTSTGSLTIAATIQPAMPQRPRDLPRREVFLGSALASLPGRSISRPEHYVKP